MADEILQLFPTPTKSVSLTGLYLAHDLRQIQCEMERIFMVVNFIASLDGRISIVKASGDEKIPRQIANARDWRLFQELAVQADLVITSGRYLREYAAGNVQDILRVYDDPALVDLKTWRLEQGLPTYPDLAVISKRLEFPVPDELRHAGRKVLVFTTHDVDPIQVGEMEKSVDQVIVVGNKSVDGVELTETIEAMGYGVVYSAAGPKVHHLLLDAGVVDRLYLTLANTIVGGEQFSSILEGPLLHPGVEFRLNTLFFDPVAISGAGQLFLSYDISPTTKA